MGVESRRQLHKYAHTFYILHCIVHCTFQEFSIFYSLCPTSNLPLLFSFKEFQSILFCSVSVIPSIILFLILNVWRMENGEHAYQIFYCISIYNPRASCIASRPYFMHRLVLSCLVVSCHFKFVDKKTQPNANSSSDVHIKYQNTNTTIRFTVGECRYVLCCVDCE